MTVIAYLLRRLRGRILNVLQAAHSFEYDGISFINTTAVHIDAAFKFAVDEPDLKQSSGRLPEIELPVSGGYRHVLT